ncbi:MerR family transcriptional regulator [Bacillus thuringiensis]|uniref:MerR family transcriptional regulator n=1 Tax=Bacillus thuringiensis TaxID=1428 RepID=UPI003CF960CE
MSNVVSLERPKRFINSKDVANALNISPSTLRTYTAHFRRSGHNFNKQQGKVLYSEGDIKLFREMIQLNQEGKGTITECVKSVLNIEDTVDTMDKENTSIQTDTKINASLPLQKIQKDYDEMKSKLLTMQDEMDKMKTYIDKRLEERDQLLISSIREVLKSKQERNKKKWWQLWKRYK